MKKEIGVILVSLTILSIPNRVFAELKFNRKSYYYGFLIGSLSESCILYKYGNINAKVLRENYESIFINVKEANKEVQKEVLKFCNSKAFPCKDFIP